MEEYYEHPAITSEEYLGGLNVSWNKGKPNQVFQFLLKQADQGDLDEAKERFADEYYAKFHQAIDEAPKPVPPAGTRIISIEKAQRVLAVLAPITSAFDEYGPGNILASYLVGEKVWAKEIEKMKLEKQKASENGGQEITSKVEEDECCMSKMCKIL